MLLHTIETMFDNSNQVNLKKSVGRPKKKSKLDNLFANVMAKHIEQEPCITHQNPTHENLEGTAVDKAVDEAVDKVVDEVIDDDGNEDFIDEDSPLEGR